MPIYFHFCYQFGGPNPPFHLIWARKGSMCFELTRHIMHWVGLMLPLWLLWRSCSVFFVGNPLGWSISMPDSGNCGIVRQKYIVSGAGSRAFTAREENCKLSRLESSMSNQEIQDIRMIGCTWQHPTCLKRGRNWTIVCVAIIVKLSCLVIVTDDWLWSGIQIWITECVGQHTSRHLSCSQAYVSV